MWNLRYGYYGESVKLGTKHKPGQPKHFKPKKKTKKQKKWAKQHKHKGFQTSVSHKFLKHIDLESIPVLERLPFLKKQLDKGFWTEKSLQLRRRDEFAKIKKKLLSLVETLCYTCGDAATVRHHIIPICKGGLNISRNLVPLCNCCHNKLHPWLIENLFIPASNTNCETTGCHNESQSNPLTTY